MNSNDKTPKWKKFERFVAAIHIAEQKGATVKWNDIIEGRQFDVTIRFKEGLYDYLTVVECKDYATSVPVKEVEAFVTKSRRAKADKAIFFSSNGFQSGAKEVAKDEKISLISINTINELSIEEISDELFPFICLFYFFRFELIDQKTFITFPEEPKVLRHMMRDTRIIGDNIDTNPEGLVEENTLLATENASNLPQTFKISLPSNTEFIHLGGLAKEKVISFLFDYCLVSTKKLLTTKGLGVDHYLTGDIYELKDEINNVSQYIDKSKYQLGFDTVVSEGKFYKNHNLDFSYFCESVQNKSVIMCLVESYQAGILVQAIVTLPIDNTKQFIEITDKKEIERLSEMYNLLKENIIKNDES